jgi:hypothetical protein
MMRMSCRLPQIYVVAWLAHLLSLSAERSVLFHFQDKVDIVPVLKSLEAKEHCLHF